MATISEELGISEKRSKAIFHNLSEALAEQAKPESGGVMIEGKITDLADYQLKSVRNKHEAWLAGYFAAKLLDTLGVNFGTKPPFIYRALKTLFG